VRELHDLGIECRFHVLGVVLIVEQLELVLREFE